MAVGGEDREADPSIEGELAERLLQGLVDQQLLRWSGLGDGADALGPDLVGHRCGSPLGGRMIGDGGLTVAWR